MGKKPNLVELKNLFKHNKDFELTDAQYERKTGAPLPKDKYYIKAKSALCKLAKEYNYNIEVIEKRVIFNWLSVFS